MRRSLRLFRFPPLVSMTITTKTIHWQSLTQAKKKLTVKTSQGIDKEHFWILPSLVAVLEEEEHMQESLPIQGQVFLHPNRSTQVFCPLLVEVGKPHSFLVLALAIGQGLKYWATIAGGWKKKAAMGFTNFYQSRAKYLSRSIGMERNLSLHG